MTKGETIDLVMEKQNELALVIHEKEMEKETPSSTKVTDPFVGSVEEVVVILEDTNEKRSEGEERVQEGSTTTAKKAAWNDLFKQGGETCELALYEPQIVNGVAICPKDILRKGEEVWKEYLVGFFMDRRIACTVVKQALVRQWKTKGPYDISTDENYFYFKFANSEDRKLVLEQGPVFIIGRVLVIKPWGKEIDEQKKKSKSIPIWVNLYGVPKKLWTKEGLSYISSLIGNPVCLDSATANKTILTFAQSCIEVKSTLDLPELLPIDIDEAEPVMIKVEYPWKPQQCSKCATGGIDADGWIKVTSNRKSPSKEGPGIISNARENEMSVAPIDCQKVTILSDEVVSSSTKEKSDEVVERGICIKYTNKYQCLEDTEDSDYEETSEALPAENTDGATAEDATSN
ncbi:hypothetical protein IFM89_000047 [Coptis chinensis]|uniref:DUF4283 domain-containing protein n=1 Tax=Coptis chinensis TaxID=261450 RepID=A0A835IS99_9MAGN|nr:hypothetical protein IFM89_000047 [Coptis chinensis]